MKKRLLALAILLLALGGGWYALSPGVAIDDLRASALARDRQALARQVDFLAVRDSLKQQMRAAMVAGLGNESDNPFAGLGLLLAGAMADPLIDAIVSPAGVEALVDHGRLLTLRDRRDGASAGDDEDKPVEWQIERQGLSRFTASPKAEAKGAAPQLIFRRDGLGWTLVDIELPRR